MNRIVREHYPVSKLPEDLRVGFEEQGQVTITIERDDQSSHDAGSGKPDDGNAAIEPGLGGNFARFKHLRRATYTSSAEIDEYVSALRDEWAHRER